MTTIEQTGVLPALVARILAATGDTDAASEIHEDLADTYGRDCGNALWCDAVGMAEAIEAAAGLVVTR